MRISFRAFAITGTHVRFRPDQLLHPAGSDDSLSVNGFKVEYQQ
jgi:hypothetical protein